MFGNYVRTFDDKYRIAIPAKLRNELGNVAYLTLGLDGLLEIRNAKEFEILKSKLDANNILDERIRILNRLLLGRSFELDIDSQGRIAIPESTLREAQFTEDNKDGMFIGIGNKIELWPKDKYEKFVKGFETKEKFDDLIKQLVKDGVKL